MKKKNFVLGFLVVVVWGIIGYKIVNAITGEQEQQSTSVRMKIIKKPLDDYELKLSYPDPFLRTQKPTRKPIRLASPPVSQVQVDWTRVKYQGMLRNVSKNVSVASLVIDSEEFIMREQQNVKGFLLIRIYPDSIYVNFEKQYKYIKINSAHE